MSEQNIFTEADRTDGDQLAAQGGAGREGPGVGAGLGGVHTGGVEPVVVEHPRAGPVAGGDDGPDRGQDRALAWPPRKRGRKTTR